MVDGVVSTLRLGSVNSAWAPCTGVLSIMSMLPVCRASASAWVSSMNCTDDAVEVGLALVASTSGSSRTWRSAWPCSFVILNGPVPTGFFCQVPVL